ncbi:hypothetical protein C8J48_2339 [Desmospora activa DSM 45169]|uniref:Uncharacterized protein n=2 Tax=Desmospora TaxID=500614 RepID=A0A2T4ZCU9_9BACL|nr:hypothetical protein C8J48_2339 [Desmospora activa DSM 45169]
MVTLFCVDDYIEKQLTGKGSEPMDKFHSLDLLMLELNLDLANQAYAPWSITKLNEINRHRRAIKEQFGTLPTLKPRI